MTELSPTAQAVFESFNSQFDWVEDGVPGPQFKAIAAALRAAAYEAPAPDLHEEDAFHAGFWAAMAYVHSIADELEAQ